MFFGIWLLPISEHSFNLKAIKKIYFGKTKNPNFFESMKNKTAKGVDPRAEEEKNFRIINLSAIQGLRIFVMDFLKTNFKCIAKKKTLLGDNNKLLKLYKDGTDMLEDELDIVNMIRNIKYFRIIMQDYLVHSDQMRFDIYYHSNNAIDLDSESDEDK